MLGGLGDGGEKIKPPRQLALSWSYRQSELKTPALGTGANRTAKVAERKSAAHASQVRAWVSLTLWGPRRGEGRTLLCPPRRREERLGEGWLARGVRKQSSPPDATPQPETRAPVISGKPKWLGDRISKAQIDWLTGDVGLGEGWGWGGSGQLGWYHCPLAKPPPAPYSRDRTQAERSNTQRPFDFISAAGQKALCVLGQRRGVPTPYTQAACCVTPARPAAGPRPWLSRCVGPIAAQAAGNWAAHP